MQRYILTKRVFMRAKLPELPSEPSRDWQHKARTLRIRRERLLKQQRRLHG